jgi:hypothetical protein
VSLLRNTHTLGARRRVDQQRAARGAARRLYADGLADGMVVALDHILNAPGAVDGYTGPLPDELREWCERARARALQVKRTER